MKKILTDLDKCPPEFKLPGNIPSCASPVHSIWDGIGYCDSPTDIACSGCNILKNTDGPDPSDEPWCKRKMNCHQWWANETNIIAKNWRDFLHTGAFDSYDWAFAEKIYNEEYSHAKPPDTCPKQGCATCSTDNNNCDPINDCGMTLDNPINPDLQCDGVSPDIRDCALNINILKNTLSVHT